MAVRRGKKEGSGGQGRPGQLAVYVLGPLAIYMLANSACAVFMEAAWHFFLQRWVAESVNPPRAYAALRAWSGLCVVLPAGLGCLCIRRQIRREMARFSIDWEEAGRRGKRAFPLLALAAVFLAIFINILASLAQLGGAQGMEAMPVDYGAGFSAMWLQVMLYVIFMPMVEEMLFRGVVFARLLRIRGRREAILVSAALFGLYHGNLPQGIYACLMGIVFAAAYDAYGHIRFSYLLHALCNLAMLALLWAGAYEALCRPAWAAAFAALAAGCLYAWRLQRKA